MKHIKRLKKLEHFELTDEEKSEVLIKRGFCPICHSKLVRNSYGEDDALYLECEKDDKHYSKYLGLWDDLN